MPATNVRQNAFLALLLVLPGGLFFKFYEGPLSWWFQDYGAGVLYEVFWILLIFLLWSRIDRVVVIPAAVFFATAGLEFLQLWHPACLEKFRATFLGAALMGTTFSWWDFPHYFIGCVLGGWLLNEFGKLEAGSASKGF